MRLHIKLEFSHGATCAREKRIAGPAGTGNCHPRAIPEHRDGARRWKADRERFLSFTARRKAASGGSTASVLQRWGEKLPEKSDTLVLS